MELEQLLYPWTGDLAHSCKIETLATDSRQVQPGALFLAYPGVTNDGRAYISQAIEKGAVAVVYDPDGFVPAEEQTSNVLSIPLEHCGALVGHIASRFYGDPSHKLSITGITGTNGKTSIAYQLAEAYSAMVLNAAYIGTLGEGQVGELNPLGNTTPDPLRLQGLFKDYLSQGIHHVAMEVSSHALVQSRVVGTAFNQAIFTNLSHDHLDYHGTLTAYAHAKAQLFTCSSLTHAIINADDPWAQLMVEQCHSGTRVLLYGLTGNANIIASDIQMSPKGTNFLVRSPWGEDRVNIKTFGTFNVYNALAVFTSLMSDGLDKEGVLQALSQINAAPGRMEIISNAPLIIVDYAHTPDALAHALSVLADLEMAKVFVVFGCGGDRDKFKRPLMGSVAEKYADHIILTNDNPRSEVPETIVDDILNGISNRPHVEVVLDRAEAIQQAIEAASPDDIILIAGKGHETTQQIGQIKHPFSDQAVVREALGGLK